MINYLIQTYCRSKSKWIDKDYPIDLDEGVDMMDSLILEASDADDIYRLIRYDKSSSPFKLVCVIQFYNHSNYQYVNFDGTLK